MTNKISSLTEKRFDITQLSQEEYIDLLYSYLALHN